MGPVLPPPTSWAERPKLSPKGGKQAPLAEAGFTMLHAPQPLPSAVALCAFGIHPRRIVQASLGEGRAGTSRNNTRAGGRAERKPVLVAALPTPTPPLGLFSPACSRAAARQDLLCWGDKARARHLDEPRAALVAAVGAGIRWRGGQEGRGGGLHQPLSPPGRAHGNPPCWRLPFGFGRERDSWSATLAAEDSIPGGAVLQERRPLAGWT